MKNISVLIADTSEIFRIGLESMLIKWSGINLVGTSIEGEDTIKKTLELKPDILLLDEKISNPECNEVSKYIKQKLPSIKIIIFSELEKGINGLFDSLESKATGYIDHHINPEILANILREAKEDDFFIAPSLGKKLVDEIVRIKLDNQRKMNFSFTKREKEMLVHIGNGLSNREIANIIFVSENTVKAHLTRILQKTNLQNRRQIILAISKGLISVE